MGGFRHAVSDYTTISVKRRLALSPLSASMMPVSFLGFCMLSRRLQLWCGSAGAITLLGIAVAHAGTLTPSASPAATSYTLSDIYTRLTTNAAATEGNHLFAPSGSPAATLTSLTQLYNVIPTIDATKVKSGTAYLGVTGSLLPNGGTATAAAVFSGATAHVTSDWTLDIGTLTRACAISTFDATANLVPGAYDGAGNGSNRWCITDSGDAVAGEILAGKTVWVDGIAIAGTMAIRTLSASTGTVLAGYYGATTLPTVDTDLTTGNIRSGVTIFGIAGSSNVVDTTTGDAVAGEILSGKTAWIDGLEITGTVTDREGDNASTARAAAGGLIYLTAPAGFYDGDDRVSATDAQVAALDADIIAGNIKSGISIFGVSGSGYVVNTGNATATAGDILSGKTAYVQGSAITGTIATRTLSAANDTVAAGYYAATTLSAVDTDLATGNIRSGVTVFGIAGNSNVVDTTTGDAVAGDLLSGKKAWVDGLEITGSATDREGDNTSTARAAAGGLVYLTAPDGFYDGDDRVSATDAQVAALDADIAASNIRSGVAIFGVNGSGYVVNTGNATAIAGDILSGKTAYAQGSAVTGTIATRTLAASTGAVLAGYYNATTLAAVDTDLAAGNIKSGTVLFGISGTLSAYTSGDNSGAYVLGTATAPGTALKNMFNGGSGSYVGGSQANGGLDDYDNNKTAPGDRYQCPAGWTACTVGNNYCGTGLASADAKDKCTGLIWSLPCKNSGCSTFTESTPTTYTWDNSGANNNSQTASQLCTSGSHGESGWSLPHQKQLLQSHIDGASQGNLEAQGTTTSYWSATTYSPGTTQAHTISLSLGTDSPIPKSSATIRIRCVR
jgi:hypothetical protein